MKAVNMPKKGSYFYSKMKNSRARTFSKAKRNPFGLKDEYGYFLTH